MAKTNISFDNKNYSIDDASLSSATTALRQHLSTTMNGTGATIGLGGTNYNIDSTKLSTATNAFVSHLGTIAGDGHKVVVNGREYGIDSAKVQGAIAKLNTAFGNLSNPDAPTPDAPTEERLEGDGAEFYTLAPTALSFRSTAPLNELQNVQINGVTVDPSNYTLEEGSTIVTFPIDYLKTLNVGNYEVSVASESKTVNGRFTVAAPELNDCGFYYNQPYSADLPMFGGVTALFVREDNTYDIITVGRNPDTGEYTIDGNVIVATHPMLGTIHCTISSDGQSIYCAEVGATFELSGSTAIAADDDYVYVYYEDLGGYEVQCIDKTKAEYGAIKTGINGIDTVKLADNMFHLDGEINSTLKTVPQIPDTVVIIGDYAFDYCSTIKSVVIPNSVMTIGIGAFHSCDGLSTVTIPDSVATIGDDAFYGCDSLKLVVIPDSVTTIGECSFMDCGSLTSIAFNGTMAQWNSITKGTNWNYDVPATHVQCSDGTVAL